MVKAKFEGKDREAPTLEGQVQVKTLIRGGASGLNIHQNPC